MRLLVLGGTLFVGRHVVEHALASGHAVTLFNRGRTNPDLFPEAERIRGDRDGDLGALAGRRFDAVVDTTGYLPRQVAASAAALAPSVERYVFVSSVSAYAGSAAGGLDETAPLAAPSDEGSEDVARDYGGLKARCEQAAEAALPGRVLTLRPGVIVGPYDPTNRFAYWVTRIARGGDVLAPEPRDQPVQVVDVRDLAAWLVHLVEQRSTGTFNVAGPSAPLTMGGLLAAIRDEVNPEARLVWVAERFLLEEGVTPWGELPLWLAPQANPDDVGHLAVSIGRALERGLRLRPLAETIRDTRAAARDAASGETRSGFRHGGLDPAREAELLRRFGARPVAGDAVQGGR